MYHLSSLSAMTEQMLSTQLSPNERPQVSCHSPTEKCLIQHFAPCKTNLACFSSSDTQANPLPMKESAVMFGMEAMQDIMEMCVTACSGFQIVSDVRTPFPIFLFSFK